MLMDNNVLVKKGRIDMDDGTSFQVFSPSQRDRLALTSTISFLQHYDTETNKLAEQVNELRKRVAVRSRNRAMMNEELQVAWEAIKAELGVPNGVQLDEIEWQPGGTFKATLPAAEPEEEDSGPATKGEGEGDVGRGAEPEREDAPDEPE